MAEIIRKSTYVGFAVPLLYDVAMGKPGRKPQAQIDALREKITQLLLNGVPTAQIATATDLSVHTVREHIRNIRKKWAEDQPDQILTRAELVQRARMIGQQAAIGASKARGSAMEVQYLKIQIEILDKVAKLTGAYAPVRQEVTGADGSAIEISRSPHEIDSLTANELSARLKVWAEDLESNVGNEEAQAKQVESSQPAE